LQITKYEDLTKQAIEKQGTNYNDRVYNRIKGLLIRSEAEPKKYSRMDFIMPPIKHDAVI
jgi:hypothetical protein